MPCKSTIIQAMQFNRLTSPSSNIVDLFPIKRSYLIMKRLMDISISLVVVLVLYPLLFPIIIVLIKLDSKGPIFFTQKRTGYLGKEFVCYKFRTMRVNDLADIQGAIHGDPRITRIGKFLRKAHFDEIPQFINVLAGDMSIVGPRPHMLREAAGFSATISNYFFRTLARPGITGLAQIIGCRGQVTCFEDIYVRYYWDAYYVRNPSIRLDLRIMAKTAILMIKGLSGTEDTPVAVTRDSLASLQSHTISSPYEVRLANGK